MHPVPILFILSKNSASLAIGNRQLAIGNRQSAIVNTPLSLLSRIYYDVKPFLPSRVRLALRRALAGRLAKKSSHIWPINPAAARKPEGWPGWPDGKQFALVLTHDVEGQHGLAKCRQLMELEMSMGFRSSFNFIPEGSYSTPPELRHELAANGFEIGVHDLHHDGKLYRSKTEFSAAAAKINGYLRDWGAAGFRSGFMHHKLDWLHALDIQYDMSTFDTDPFEPQPDGVHTIFPFFVPALNGTAPRSSAFRPSIGNRQPGIGNVHGGYLELPYTLPQDSTLFLFLEHRDISVWQKKLRWIATHGGMALLNVHPDYIDFDGTGAPGTYPAALYADFLRWVRSEHNGQFWNALPAEAARFARATGIPLGRPSRKRVAMISYSFYESDNRVRRYAESLVARGDSVDVIAIAGPQAPSRETLRGVRVHRIQRRVLNEKGKRAYLVRLLRFLCASSALLSWRHIRQHYEVVHVHNVPDFLVFAAWLPRLTGARVILDIHDILPEFFAAKFKVGPESHYVRALQRIEKLSCRFAHHVIISNHLWHDKIIARSVPPEKCSPIINYVDTSVFYPRPRTRRDEKLIVLFPGGLQWHQGLDIAIRAFTRVREVLPRCELHIYGDGGMKPSLIALRDELGLRESVRFFDPLSLTEIADVIANADLGVVPKRADSFGNEAYSTKIMEFMSQGVPVAASATRIDQFYFDPSMIRFFKSGDHEDLSGAIVELLQDPARAASLVQNARAYVNLNNWEGKKLEYFDIVDNLTGPVSDRSVPSVRAQEPESALLSV